MAGPGWLELDPKCEIARNIPRVTVAQRGPRVIFPLAEEGSDY